MVASGELISSYDSSEMVRQARILAQSTAELIQAIKGEAETQSDSDLQVQLLSLKPLRLGSNESQLRQSHPTQWPFGLQETRNSLSPIPSVDSLDIWRYESKPKITQQSLSRQQQQHSIKRFSFYENVGL